MKQKKHRFTLKHLVIILVLLLVLIGIGSLLKENFHQGQPLDQESIVKTLVMNAAKSVMNELKLVLTDIKDNNLESARTRIASIQSTVRNVQTTVKSGMPVLGFSSQLQKKLETALKLLDTADMALTEIALPAIELLEENPISELKVGDGFNTKLVGCYLDFAESVMPRVETVLKTLDSLNLKEVDSDGEITEYLELANKIVAIHRADPTVFSMIKSIIGAEEDRLYVVAAQNSSEIRASGGFPGSIGVMRIQGGILTIGDFKSVTYVLSAQTPKDIQITREERELFGYLSGIQTPRDADLCPDFQRVGHIWASAYEEMNGEPVAGVISLTPHIVQRILAATGAEIELFDGLTLNGENAMEVLLHDIYYKYFSKEFVAGRGETSDELFADAAEKTMKLLTENVSVSQLLKYAPILKESFDDRTMMIWMRDQTEQDFIVRKGWSGGLNADPEQPQTGVYFNCIFASKMGWYFLMDTDIGERIKNEDGSYTYPVTVTFTNNATSEEIKTAGSYITGNLNGSICGAAYFFAPAGGTVSDFSASNGQKIQIRTYNGMELGFMDAFILKPDAPITITYLVTTASGVETPLTINRTPTAQQ